VKLILNQLTNEVPPPVKGTAKAGKKPIITSKQIAARYKAMYEMILNNAFTPDQ